VIRELAIALRARVTWIVAAIAALLVGHGFVLAMDLFSAASRSATAGTLQSREMDPLLGIVRPTLGGVDLALTILGPIVAARVVSIEKERRTLGALLLQVGSPHRVLLRKALASSLATSLLLLPALIYLVAYAFVGGHLDVPETVIAIAGALLHLLVVVAVSVAAAMWTRTFAQAITVSVLFSLSSWMIDAGEGFAALAWLGRAESWSIERQLGPAQHGIIAMGPMLWLLVLVATSLAVAAIGARLDWNVQRRSMATLPIALVALCALAGASSIRRGYDWTEQRRASLPPDVVRALRDIRQPISIRVALDRDDSRRRQLQSDALAKLVLARPDVILTFPLDARTNVAEGDRDDRYGRIEIVVGDRSRETRSASRKELVTLVLEAAGQAQPDWAMPIYPGYPTVIEGSARTAIVLLAYGLMPFSLLGIGFALARRRTRS
jgi:hypothetical protein